jgi:hypothetical protein
LPGRSLNFTKTSSSSRLKVSYVDSFGVCTSGVGSYSHAVWELTVVNQSNGSETRAARTIIYQDGAYGSWHIRPGNLTGLVSGLPAGSYSVQVRVWRSGGLNSITGWDSTFYIEAQEIP